MGWRAIAVRRLGPTQQSPQRLLAVPVFAPRLAPPPDVRSSYSLPPALDEYSKWFGEWNDISDYHRNGTKSRIASIKLHVEDITAEEGGLSVRLADLPMTTANIMKVLRA
jgi:hypothetical protein